MKARLGIVAIVLTLIFFSCKKESSVTMNYEHSDKPSVVNCQTADSLLLKEALYTFETDIANAYDPQGKNLRRAVPTFIRNISSGRVDYNKLTSEHAVEVYNVLKSSQFWKDGGLDYNNSLFSCLGENIKYQSLKTTYNSLITSGYMNEKLFAAPLASKTNAVISDKYLATFIALDFYFSHLEGITPTPPAPKVEKANDGPVDFNKVPAKTAQ